ncbi:MAG: polysaccharide biosynthesis/export family protein [Deltaproteobacteria bacterium]|nr:polysaccharide biosynthesis/export family protein [Deltaproteobacteria bacterium]
MANNFLRLCSSLILIPVFLTSCVIPQGGSPLEELLDNSGEEGAYKIKANDVLHVEVWGEPKLSGDLAVRDDGKVTMQLINDVNVAGFTAPQVAKAISDKLSKFVPSAYVAVSVVQSAPTRYFLVGKFARPGQYTSAGKITLLQAIATGGGFAPFANENYVTLIRKTAEGEIRYHLDYNRMIDNLEPNPFIKEGDTIVVR